MGRRMQAKLVLIMDNLAVHKHAAIKNLIRENKIAQMYSAIQTGNSMGMQTLDQNLADLVRRNVISSAEARAKAKIPENFPG